MRFIAIIAVVAIIVVGVLIALAISRFKDRQAEQLYAAERRLELAQKQNKVMSDELKTIRDLQNENSFSAMTALEKVEELRDTHYRALEKA